MNLSSSDTIERDRVKVHRHWTPGTASLARTFVFVAMLTIALVTPASLSVCHAGTAWDDRTPGPAILGSQQDTCESCSRVTFNIAPVGISMTGTDPVVRIDEDWELNITEPDAEVAAPQVSTVMSPHQTLNGFYITFLINHRFNPLLALGGMEVQFWNGDQQLASRRDDSAVLQHSNEKVTWTQRMHIKDLDSAPYLCFRIVDGQSETWGAFGGTEPLHINIDTSLTDLSGYQSQFSIDNSGVIFSSNRVSSLILKAVRGYSAGGELVFEDSQPVVVYSASN